MRPGTGVAALLLLLVAFLVPVAHAQFASSNLDWDNYFGERTLALDAQAGMAMLTDAQYSPVDYYPGYGMSLEYYLPALVAIGFDFEQSQKDGHLTIPTKNLGDLEGRGRITLTAYSLQVKFSSPVLDDHYNIYLAAGVGSYVVNLNARTDITVPYQGEEYTFQYDLKYTIVENGLNGGLGIDLVYFDALKIGFAGRLHYILEKEKDTDFGAINIFFKIGYTL